MVPHLHAKHYMPESAQTGKPQVNPAKSTLDLNALKFLYFRVLDVHWCYINMWELEDQSCQILSTMYFLEQLYILRNTLKQSQTKPRNKAYYHLRVFLTNTLLVSVLICPSGQWAQNEDSTVHLSSPPAPQVWEEQIHKKFIHLTNSY